MSVSTAPHNLRDRLMLAIIVALAAVTLVLGFLLLRRQQQPPPAPVWFTVETPGHGSLPLFGRPTVSPHGQSVLCSGNDPLRKSSVCPLHSFGTGTSRIVPGSETMIAVNWSFDSRSILLRRG